MSRKKRDNTKNIICILIIILIILIALICGNYEYLEKFLGIKFKQQVDLNSITAEQFENIELEEANLLKIYFFDVGQADSILIVSSNETMLIDAGNNDDGDLIVNNIKNLGISKLNYVVGTHPHEDHIGGLDTVIDSFEVENVWMPKVQTNTKTFEDVLDSIANKNLKITSPKVETKISLGDSQIEVMLCKEENVKQSNLNLASIALRLTYKDQSYLFMGDAEVENEQSRMWQQTNVLKVGHHGSKTSSGEDFLNQIKPQIAIIQVGKNNSYSHPSKETLEKLSKLGTIIYRTDENGSILIESDGINNKVSFFKNL